MTKRFTEIISTQNIRDNVTGKIYNGWVDDDLLDLINQESRRADRNAELLDMDKITLAHKVRRIETMNSHYIETISKLEKIMAKYEIDSLEKLDLVLFYQRVW